MSVLLSNDIPIKQKFSAENFKEKMLGSIFVVVVVISNITFDFIMCRLL